jgi:hypothetical protein
VCFCVCVHCGIVIVCPLFTQFQLPGATPKPQLDMSRFTQARHPLVQDLQRRVTASRHRQTMVYAQGSCPVCCPVFFIFAHVTLNHMSTYVSLCLHAYVCDFVFVFVFVFVSLFTRSVRFGRL